MIAFVGGLVAFILGVIGLAVWWTPFVTLLKAGLPVLFILGGGLAAYMGAQELKDKMRAKNEATREPFAADADQAEALERYRNEVQELKDRLAALEKNDDKE